MHHTLGREKPLWKRLVKIRLVNVRSRPTERKDGSVLNNAILSLSDSYGEVEPKCLLVFLIQMNGY